MTEDGQLWAKFLSDESFRELFSGKGVISDYIELRERNNEVRARAIQALFAAVQMLAAEASHSGMAVDIEEFKECRLEFGSTKATGPGLRVRHGVRCLTFESGWTRNPSDGVMPEGSLALARISHFGMSEKTAVLYLLVFEDRPRWFTIGRDGIRRSFEADDLVVHFSLLVQEV